MLAIAINAAENISSNPRQARRQVHGVFISSIPILGFVHARGVALAIHWCFAWPSRPRKTGSWVRFQRQGINGAEHVFRHVRPAHPVVGQPLDLLFGGNFTTIIGQKRPSGNGSLPLGAWAVFRGFLEWNSP